MDSKIKDVVFSILMLALGTYVTIEGVNIYRKAAQPPYRIEAFSISPGFLPIILGVGLIALSLILLVRTLVQEKVTAEKFAGMAKTFGKSFASSFKDKGMIRMITGTAIMAVLTFVLMGLIPFWAGGTIFLIGMMFYLKATKWWIILLSSVGTIGVIYLLFQFAFKTILP